ncbi:beta-aryl ether-cleaving protein [Pseudorhizobium endolithicum]|uniref:Beta-aryl ether-cleaving protein n=1 Tax=Pseudorhizobium endolithicum TaxID=1191678 RepID=A0ABN7JKA5_9HYPH|nr:glutathione S-transferase family protein [Pseudorhizobium endolithicum]CAD7033777.1 beta-aryl ether-cleaving protein [Pseudorhizobium endolithicum]
MTRVLYSLCGRDESRPFSPHCWKISMALAHKGLDYVERPYPFTAIPTIEEGFSKTVPILRDGDRLVRDSFEIALYLDEAYQNLPTLFGGEGGKSLSRFVESFSQMIIHMPVTRMAILHIHDMLDEPDQAYFRRSRLERLGKPIEEVAAESEAERLAFASKLEPVRRTLHFQPYLGGDTPLFADYILFGALQWMRVTAGPPPLAQDDSVMQWFERCLDLHGGLGRRVTAA